MQHRCTACGTETVETRQTLRFEAPLGTMVLHEVPTHHCPRCGDHEIALSHAPKLRNELALAIARKREALAPREIRFLREYLGLSPGELADTVGVTEEIAARWENVSELEAMDVQAERLLRVLVMTSKPMRNQA
jgi:putative zinc finger/helix-turn-helix YgiT family protein